MGRKDGSVIRYNLLLTDQEQRTNGFINLAIVLLKYRQAVMKKGGREGTGKGKESRKSKVEEKTMSERLSFNQDTEEDKKRLSDYNARQEAVLEESFVRKIQMEMAGDDGSTPTSPLHPQAPRGKENTRSHASDATAVDPTSSSALVNVHSLGNGNEIPLCRFKGEPQGNLPIFIV